MLSKVGNNIQLSIDGASHAKQISMVLSGIKKGEKIDVSLLQQYVDRRKAKNNVYSTKRLEPDKLIIKSGIVNNITTGKNIEIIVENTNVKSGDYKNLVNCPRPSHADYPAYIKYNGKMDMKGGGAFSGRMTLPLVIAGGICSQILERKNIITGAYINEIFNINSGSYENNNIDENILKSLKTLDFPILNINKKPEMLQAIENASKNQNSVGGKIEAVALNVPCGTGEMIFDSLESQISRVMFSIPAVKAVEFGIGTSFSSTTGFDSNDNYYVDDDNKIKTKTNNNGGILGGLANGMPICLRVTIKPTPSISKPQNTVNLDTNTNTTIEIKGRHDSCIVPRAVVVVESALSFVLLDNLYKGDTN